MQWAMPFKAVPPAGGGFHVAKRHLMGFPVSRVAGTAFKSIALLMQSLRDCPILTLQNVQTPASSVIAGPVPAADAKGAPLPLRLHWDSDGGFPHGRCCRTTREAPALWQGAARRSCAGNARSVPAMRARDPSCQPNE